MSRRSRRYRARFAATVQIGGVEHTLVCTTRDISDNGCFLDTSERIAHGVPLVVCLMDNASGSVVIAEGEVARISAGGPDGDGRGIGVRLYDPPDAWANMVERYESSSSASVRCPPRMAILVVGEKQRRRAALALYVTSGWDVRFAADQATAEEALGAIELDAVIAEHTEHDHPWTPIFEAARRMQPGAQRIARYPLRGQNPPPRGSSRALVHRVVDLDSGIDALVDALLSGPNPR